MANTTPSPSQLTVLTLEGEVRALSDYTTERDAVIVLVRHFG